jgi:3-oxoacyl-[acyl-carrier-protein] synthase II
MSGKAVAITGVGVITSLGQGKEQNWAKLSAGVSGIHRLSRFNIDNMKTTIGGSVDFVDIEKNTAPDLTFTMAKLAVTEALDESGIGSAGDFPGQLFLAAPPVEQEWPQRKEMAAATGKTDCLYTDILANPPDNRPDLHADFLYRTVGDRLADTFGTKGSPITLSTACASGATAIQLGVEAIRRGACKAALAVGTDGSMHPESLIRFTLLSALSTSNEDPEKAAKPFSKDRDGFVMAEGAAALILEDPDAAEARGATILGYIRGCGEAADTFHRTRSNPTGEAVINCMTAALSDAGIDPSAVDYINAHGTSTPENDKMECLSIHEVFGDAAQTTPVSSNKSMIGHTLTAAGAVEAVFSLLTIKNQMLPPTINYDVPDPALELDVVPNAARAAEVKTVMSNSFGFGGQNVCLILSSEPG